MSDEPKESVIVLRLSDPKTWALFAAIVGAQGVVGKLSVAGVETQQEQVKQTATKAVEKQESIDDKLGELRKSQDQSQGEMRQFVGEMRYRLEQVERQVREAGEKVKGSR